jgi:hypothetical protein
LCRSTSRRKDFVSRFFAPASGVVGTGNQTSADAVFQGYPTDVLRVAVVANWQGKPNLQGLMKDKIHLLPTAGDNIPDLHSKCGVGTKDCTKPYEALIDSYPELFRSIPFMPALGNHDREIRPRGPSRPLTPFTTSTPRRSASSLTFLATNGNGISICRISACGSSPYLNHIQDGGTTWQTCHD